jgi:hypothetical protein
VVLVLMLLGSGCLSHQPTSVFEAPPEDQSCEDSNFSGPLGSSPPESDSQLELVRMPAVPTIESSPTRTVGDLSVADGEDDKRYIPSDDLSKEGLIGHWEFGQGTGYLVADSSQGANHGILNGATWTKEQGTGALFFDGEDDFVEIRDLPSLDARGRSFTIAAWVKTPNSFWKSPAFRLIAGKVSKISYQGTSTDGWGLLLSSERLSLALPNLNPDEFVSDAAIITTDTWHHVGVAYDAAAKEVSYYLDGAQVGGEKATAGVESLDNDFPFRIGVTADGNRHIKATITDVRIYCRALTLSEMAMLSDSPPLADSSYNLQFHIYRRLDEVINDFKPYVRADDTFVIGRLKNAVDWEREKDLISQLNSEFPGNTVYVRTSGWNRLMDTISTIPDGFTPAILHTYEPQNEEDYGPYSSQGPHDFEYVLARYEVATKAAHAKGIQLWAVPSGRYIPVVGDLRQHNWDYARLAQVVDRVIVQTQGYCKQDQYQVAVDAVNRQFYSAGLVPSWVDMIAVGEPEEVQNSMEASVVWPCIQRSNERGLKTHAYQWWNMDHALEFLELREVALSSQR